jgi:hypothetical protein
VPSSWTTADAVQLARYRNNAARAANAALFGALRRRRLLARLGVTVVTTQQRAACTLLRDFADVELRWRALASDVQPSDARLVAQLDKAIENVRGASTARAAASVAAGATAGNRHIQEMLASAHFGGSHNSWNILPRLLPHVRGWAVSSLSARNFPLRAGLFDLVVIDEASQCSIAAVLPLLFRAKTALIVGDPMQLRHIATLRPDQDAAISETLGIAPAWLAERRLTYQRYSCYDAWEARTGESLLLDEHYRCHPQIAAIADDLFYAPRGKGLTILTDVREQRSVPGSSRPRVAWDHVSAGRAIPGPGRRSWLNRAEAEQVAARTRWLLGVLPSAASIGIVTPFKAHADLVRQLLGDLAQQVRVGTVHTFQGGECDAMLFSLVATASMTGGGLRFFDRDENLWNVAITRAKSHLLIVGDRGFWEGHGALGGKLGSRIDAITAHDAHWPHGDELQALLYDRLQELGAEDLELAVPGLGYTLDARFTLDGKRITLLLDPGPQQGQNPGRHLRQQIARTHVMTTGDVDTAVRRFPAWHLYSHDTELAKALNP